jgi:antitoxin ParD1/3/4
MPTRNVVLSEEQEKHLRELVAEGRYQNISEVIRAGVRLILSREAEEQARIEGLRAAVAVGEADVANGDVEDYDPTMLDRIEEELDRER